MKSLEPDKYEWLSKRYDGPLGESVIGNGHMSLVLELLKDGLIRKDPPRLAWSSWCAHISSQGQLAVRVHRAYLASLVRV